MSTCTMLKKPRPCRPYAYGCGGSPDKPCDNRVAQLHRCPCDRAVKCGMSEPCLGCEVYAKWLEKVGEMSEGRRCWIPISPKWRHRVEDINRGASEEGRAFTLPELAERDARIRREALEEAAKYVDSVRIEAEDPGEAYLLQILTGNIRALIEKETTK